MTSTKTTTPSTTPSRRSHLRYWLWQWCPLLMWRRFRWGFTHAHLDGDRATTYTVAHGRTRAVCECGASEWWG